MEENIKIFDNELLQELVDCFEYEENYFIAYLNDEDLKKCDEITKENFWFKMQRYGEIIERTDERELISAQPKLDLSPDRAPLMADSCAICGKENSKVLANYFFPWEYRAKQKDGGGRCKQIFICTMCPSCFYFVFDDKKTDCIIGLKYELRGWDWWDAFDGFDKYLPENSKFEFRYDFCQKELIERIYQRTNNKIIPFYLFFSFSNDIFRHILCNYKNLIAFDI
jgi:hypothetical protein